ncbi:unnamed protein product [Orchesella dallaii]|uniref:Uncharacterized protein n=1 Tax=Orchesella dallaii TaxID=48710 RepID=A0ABP1R913_9HEXA
MNTLSYMSHNELREAVFRLADSKPAECCGFKMKRLTDVVYPMVGLNFDGNTSQPITHLCTHKPFECQPWAEMAYILVYAYAVSDINKPLWRHLFPTRSTPMMPGVPHFGEVRTGSCCCGFRIVQGPGNNNANSIPAGMIRAGYEVDPTTLCAYTEPCPHTNCDASTPYMYAIIKAFASDLLMFYGFEMTTDEPMKGTLSFKFYVEFYYWIIIKSFSS